LRGKIDGHAGSIDNVPIDKVHPSDTLVCEMSMLNLTEREAGLHMAIRILAMPGKEALDELPLCSNRADRLALSFDEHYTVFMESMTVLPEEAQLLSLQALDSALNAISGPENLALWDDVSFIQDPHWENIRLLAQKVMIEFGWS